MFIRLFNVLAISLVLLQLTACASPSPTSKLIKFSDDQRFERSTIQANGFELLALQTAAQPVPGGSLHVYLEGDGTPWRYRVVKTRDPTPRQPLMLRLMAQDDSPSLYLGRPCYNGSFADKGCSDDLWTSARYSETVVSSMADAINTVIRDSRVTDVRLFGHSGGGTLAVLIAERVPEVNHVITLAGNLDPDAWVAHHQYESLYGSLNPAKRTPLRATVEQWHLLGRNDEVIPPALVKPFIQRQTNVFATEIGVFSHGCCWRKIWPSVLIALERDDTGRIPGLRLR